MRGIFISYRRSDSEVYAAALAQEVQRGLSAWKVFLDLEGIDSGQDFAKIIRSALADSPVMLVVIGQGWLHAHDSAGRRLDRHDDWVRTEIREALQLKRRVIPVLVQSAAMPAADDLPDDIRQLAALQAYRVSNIAVDAHSLCDLIALRQSIAEPVIVMAVAASLAIALRTGQRGRLPIDALEQFSQTSLNMLRSVFSVTGNATYYTVLAMGLLLAFRYRIGWRFEESLRVAASGGLAVGLAEVGMLAVVGGDAAALAQLGPVRVSFWFASLAVGVALGARQFTAARSGPEQPWVVGAWAFGLSAILGTLLQDLFNTQFPGVTDNPRTLLWGALLAGTTVAWRACRAKTATVSWRALLQMLAWVLAAMCIADLTSVLTRPVLALEDGQHITVATARALQEKMALDNALFFGLAVGVGAWRIHAEVRRRFDLAVGVVQA